MSICGTGICGRIHPWSSRVQIVGATRATGEVILVALVGGELGTWRRMRWPGSAPGGTVQRSCLFVDVVTSSLSPAVASEGIVSTRLEAHSGFVRDAVLVAASRYGDGLCRCWVTILLTTGSLEPGAVLLLTRPPDINVEAGCPECLTDFAAAAAAALSAACFCTFRIASSSLPGDGTWLAGDFCLGRRASRRLRPSPSTTPPRAAAKSLYSASLGEGREEKGPEDDAIF